MIKIFSKELKQAVKDAMKSITSPETKAKIVKMYQNTEEAVQNFSSKAKEAFQEMAADQAVEMHPTKEELRARTKAKFEERQRAKDEAKAKHDEIRQAIVETSSAPDVEEVYCQRSFAKPTFKELGTEDLPIVTEVAKVTVIGVVKRLSDDRFRLQVSFSRRNPNDPFIKNLGYLTALKRAYDPRATFEIEGHDFETIKVGDFESPLLKDLFLAIADEIIYKYEYSEDHYTKAMRNSIHRNAQDLIDYVKESI
jgi:hypothetical protein